MKLENNTKTDYSSTIELEGIDAQISEDKISKLWDMLQAPYKNTIGSVVREITSNCFDSHAEANVDDAVVINIDKDDSGYYIEFCDVGTGLSPQRIKEIYSKYLNSTKEDSDDFIGCWGIGSKSPLSYTDMFFITTVSEGIEYQYIMRKGEKSPRIEKLTETPIEERNGTKIKIYMVVSSDTGKFVDECKKQLAYFDNVYINISDIVKSVYSFSFNNDYKITEGNHFKIKDINNPYQGLHLCLGKVAYPIDWNNLGISSNRFSSLNLALKFEIGELPITFTREDIKYTEESIKTVKNKIKLLMEELVDLYNDQDDVKKDYDYFDLTVLKHNSIDGFYVGHVYIDNMSINISKVYTQIYGNYPPDVWLNTRDFKKEYFTFKINDIGFEKEVRIISNSSYKGLPFEVSYNRIHNLFYLHYSLVKKINTNDARTYSFGKNDSTSQYIADKILRKEYPLILIKDKDLDLKTNKYLVYEIFPKKLDVIKKSNSQNLIPYNIVKDYIPLLDKKKRSLKIYKSILNLQTKPKKLWRQLIEVYQKTIEDKMVPHAENYSKYQPDDKWYKEWKKNHQPAVSYNKTTTGKGEYNLFVLNQNLRFSVYPNTTSEDIRQDINPTSYFNIIKDTDIQNLDNLVVTVHDNKVEIGLGAIMFNLINPEKKNMFVTTTEKNIEKLKKIHKNVKMFEEFIEENIDLISDYYNVSLILNSPVIMDDYKYNYYTKNYNTELTFIEIFNPGLSSFTVDIEKEMFKISGLDKLKPEEIKQPNLELFRLGIDFIDKFMKSEHPKAKVIEIKSSSRLNDLKKKIKDNQSMIEKLKFMRSIKFNDYRYNGLDNNTKFEILNYLNLVDNNCEIIKNYGKLQDTQIYNIVMERLKKLSFFDFGGFKTFGNYDLLEIIKDYDKMIKKSETNNKLIEKV